MTNKILNTKNTKFSAVSYFFEVLLWWFVCENRQCIIQSTCSMFNICPFQDGAVAEGKGGHLAAQDQGTERASPHTSQVNLQWQAVCCSLITIIQLIIYLCLEHHHPPLTSPWWFCRLAAWMLFDLKQLLLLNLLLSLFLQYHIQKVMVVRFPQTCLTIS